MLFPKFFFFAYFFISLWIILGAKCTATFLDRCITYIGENAGECIKTNSFLNLTKDGIVKLISSDYVSSIEQFIGDNAK